MSDEHAEVIMYLTSWCPFCHAAKGLLDGKGVRYREIDVDADPELRREMEQASGRRTVPQVFIDGEPHGGYTDLLELDRRGRLDAILGLSQAT